VAALAATIAVGGPNLVFGEGWDVAPLVLMVMFIILIRWARIPLGPISLLSAVLAGLLVDVFTDVSGASLPLTVAVLTLVFGIVALKRIPAR
jgi:hypothetical protein